MLSQHAGKKQLGEDFAGCDDLRGSNPTTGAAKIVARGNGKVVIETR
jgi:hypothetical protein